MKIVPSILTEQLDGLKDLLRKAETFTDYVQIDFMDGVFVPSKSILPRQMDGIETSLVSEAHLMTEKPANYVRDLRTFGVKRIIFHYEADPHPQNVIGKIRGEGMEVGIALNPETEISRLDDLVPDLDSILFLSVNPGFYGSPFIPSVLDKIAVLRERYASIVIGIDGGVALDNIRDIKALGVNYACVGSRIFLSDDPAGRFRAFEQATRS